MLRIPNGGLPPGSPRSAGFPTTAAVVEVLAVCRRFCGSLTKHAPEAPNVDHRRHRAVGHFLLPRPADAPHTGFTNESSEPHQRSAKHEKAEPQKIALLNYHNCAHRPAQRLQLRLHLPQILFEYRYQNAFARPSHLPTPPPAAPPLAIGVERIPAGPAAKVRKDTFRPRTYWASVERKHDRASGGSHPSNVAAVVMAS